MIDPLIKVYDIRAMRSLLSIAFPSLPGFIRPHPQNTSTIVIVSAQGQVQVSDLSQPAAVEFFSVETDSYLTTVALAPTGEGLASTDAEGLLHICSRAGLDEEPRYARFQNEIELPHAPEPFKRVDWTDETPLSMIGLPFYDKPLFSIIPWTEYSSGYSPFGRPPEKIDSALLASMKTVDFVGYAVNPKTNKRNQASLKGISAKDVKRAMDVPLFRSEKDRERTQRRKQRKMSEPVSKLTCHTDLSDHIAIKLGEETEEEGDASQTRMPKHYRKVEIKYSRFGVEDFDFA